MLDPEVIRHTFLTKLLDWSAAVNTHGTAAAFQAWVLRRLGARVGGPVAIAGGTTFLGAENLVLGRYIALGTGTRIVSWAGVEIGDDFIASDLLSINDGGHDPVSLVPKLAPIKIGHRVWCGANVTICAGVTIGDDVVIGAGSVVIRSIPANSVAAGVPARVLRPLGREGQQLWSLWPERSSGYDMANAAPWKRRLHWLRARL